MIFYLSHCILGKNWTTLSGENDVTLSCFLTVVQSTLLNLLQIYYRLQHMKLVVNGFVFLNVKSKSVHVFITQMNCNMRSHALFINYQNPKRSRTPDIASLDHFKQELHIAIFHMDVTLCQRFPEILSLHKTY